MIDRENLGVVGEFEFEQWPRFSVPCPVEDIYYDLVSRLPGEVTTRIVGKGYHNQGYSYLEVEVRSPSWGRAYDEAERLSNEIQSAFHWREVVGEE